MFFFQQWKPLSDSGRLTLERNSSSLVELTQSADGAAVGLVAQSVCAGVAETQVSARQDECVSHIRQTHHTLGAVVTDLIVSNLEMKKHLNVRKKENFYVIESSYRQTHSNRSRQKKLSCRLIFTFDSWLLYLFSIP